MVPSVLIVIVNYKTADLAIECLRSIEGQAGSSPELRVVVVDNASNDGSVERLSAAIAGNRWRDWASVIPSDRNGGFAAGNNLAISEELSRTPGERSRYILLLNPDTIVRPGAISELAAFMERRPEVGVAGSRIEDGNGRPAGSARRFPTPLGELESAARFGPLTRMLRRYAIPMIESGQPLRCDWVSGAAMMIRAEVFSTVGLLDEDYFLYYEETDFCHRAVLAGWQVWSIPQSRVVHFEGSSTGIRDRNRRRPRYWYDSRRRFFIKVHGPWQWFLADCCWAVGRLIWTVQKLSGFVRCRDDDPRGFACDLLGGDWAEATSGRWRRIPGAGAAVGARGPLGRVMGAESGTRRE